MVSNMAKHDPHLDLLFHALSDPTRRMMLNRLAKGPAPVTELAGPTGLKLPTILRHLSVLEAAGLVATQKDGRVRSCAFQPKALQPMTAWLEENKETPSRPNVKFDFIDPTKPTPAKPPVDAGQPQAELGLPVATPPM